MVEATADDRLLDVVIIGGGPGGISAAVEAKAAGLDYVLLEKKKLGNTLDTQYPKGKSVDMDYHGVTAEFIGQMSFDKGSMPLDEFLLDLSAWTSDLNYHEEEGVDWIIPQDDGLFQIHTWKDEPYTARKVIIAIGQYGKPNTLPMWKEHKRGFPAELRDLVHFSLDDPNLYSGEIILVIGGGDTAIETALALKDKNEVNISYRKPEFLLGKRLSQTNYDDVQRALDAEEMYAVYRTNLTKATPTTDEHGKKTLDVILQHEDGLDLWLPYNRMYLCLGGTTPKAFLEQAGVSLDGRRANVDQSTYESPDAPGIYVIGDLVAKKDKAIVTAMKHAVRAIDDIKQKL